MINLEDTFKYFLQREIIFSIENKVIKRGKLILCNIKDFYITFYLRYQNEQKKYELPYPFKITRENNKLLLNYELRTLAHNNDDLLFKLQSLNKKKNTKIFNSVVTISVV